MKGVSPPRAVVIPFGVPDSARGVGLGLAALVQGFTRVAGGGVALAQLLASREDEAETSTVESFVAPAAWSDLVGRTETDGAVSMVLTGAFEPPTHAKGQLQLLLFDPRSGDTRASIEAEVDSERAGGAILGALEHVWRSVGGELGAVRDIDDLSWDALESVLHAERCALYDPARGGPHDRMAAMSHLERAVGDAPEASFPAGRLAALALDIALSDGGRLAEPALRALSRASGDAPRRLDLVEAAAALEIRMGRASDAARRLSEVLEKEGPDRAGRSRLLAALSEAHRAKGRLDDARAIVLGGLAEDATDLSLLTEHGTILRATGDSIGARARWLEVLDRAPMHPAAFVQLADVVLEDKDPITAQRLVDQALASGIRHAEILRRSLAMILATETPGLARGARVRRLAETLVAEAPTDPWAAFTLARALADTGERALATRELARIERTLPRSAVAAEAQRGRVALLAPERAAELDDVLANAYTASEDALPSLSALAQDIAEQHDVWPGWFAAGVAQRRLSNWALAEIAFERALRSSPGCTPAHMELVAVLLATGRGDEAVVHARRARELEGDTARTLAILATALLAAGSRDHALEAIDRALALDASDQGHRELRDKISRSDPPPRPSARDAGADGPFARVRALLDRFRRK